MSALPLLSSKWAQPKYRLAFVLLIVACRASTPPQPAERPAPGAPERDEHPPCTWTVTSLPRAGSNQLAATEGGLVFIDGDRPLFSTDRGRTFVSPPWLASGLAVPNAEPRFLTSNARTLYLATPAGVLAIDDADVVRRLPLPGSGLPDDGLFELIDFKASATGLYALFRSEDVAATSEAGSEPRKPRYSGHLYRSVDDGATWAEEAGIDALEHGGLEKLLINGSAQRFVNDDRYHWLSSVDDGAHWSLLPPLPAIGSLAIGTRSLLLVAEKSAGANLLLRSADAGRTWQAVDHAPSLGELTPAGDDDWSATNRSHFLRSVDDGRHWRRESVAPQDPLAAESLSAEIVFWTSLWRSRDEGYALGFVNPGLRFPRRTSLKTRDERLLAHGACSKRSR